MACQENVLTFQKAPINLAHNDISYHYNLKGQNIGPT